MNPRSFLLLAEYVDEYLADTDAQSGSDGGIPTLAYHVLNAIPVSFEPEPWSPRWGPIHDHVVRHALDDRGWASGVELVGLPDEDGMTPDEYDDESPRIPGRVSRSVEWNDPTGDLAVNWQAVMARQVADIDVSIFDQLERDLGMTANQAAVYVWVEAYAFRTDDLAPLVHSSKGRLDSIAWQSQRQGEAVPLGAGLNVKILTDRGFVTM